MKKIILLGVPMLLLLSFTGQQRIPVPQFDAKKLEKSLVHIPAGSFEYGLREMYKSKAKRLASQFGVQLDSMYIFPSNRNIKQKAFYIAKYEVSNADYLAFLYDLKKTNSELYEHMLPDTIRDYYAYCEPVLDSYHSHPAFYDFPCIGITYNQAIAYCDWLTQKYQLVEGRKFKHAVFKLPTIGQWTFAAQGGKEFSWFPWKEGQMKNEKGFWLANFGENYTKNGYAGFEQKKKEKVMLIGISTLSIANISAYPPNTFGLHNMAGNVEEYVREKGITKGGSWLDPGLYLQTWVEERYDSTNAATDERGFRIVMEVE